MDQYSDVQQLCVDFISSKTAFSIESDEMGSSERFFFYLDQGNHDMFLMEVYQQVFIEDNYDLFIAFIEMLYIEGFKSRLVTKTSSILTFESNNIQMSINIDQSKLKVAFGLNTTVSYDINRESYTNLKLLGEGSYGSVYGCCCGTTKCALKFQRLYDARDHDEFKILHFLNMQYVDGIIQVKQFACTLNAFGVNFNIFVMPLMDCTLCSYVRNNRCTNHFLLTVFRDLLVCLNKIHKLGYYHLDIKPPNILVKTLVDAKGRPEPIIKLCDFGLAEKVKQGKYIENISDPKVTSWYRCPINSKAEKDKSVFFISWVSDLYALSVSILQLCSLNSSGHMFSSPAFEVFRKQDYFIVGTSEIGIHSSREKIRIACETAIPVDPVDPTNLFFRNLLIEYMDPENILRWYSELQTTPHKNNSVIPEVILKITAYLEHLKQVEVVESLGSDVDTPPRPHEPV